MGVKTSGVYCGNCKKNVMAQRNAPNHILHLVLSVMTVGFWLVVWVLLAIAGVNSKRCTECGQKM